MARRRPLDQQLGAVLAQRPLGVENWVVALGARTVGIGRLACLGLAAAGVPGLVRTLELLEEEVRTCLGLLGAASWAELTPAHLAAAPPVSAPDTFSAFPLLP